MCFSILYEALLSLAPELRWREGGSEDIHENVAATAMMKGVYGAASITMKTPLRGRGRQEVVDCG